MSTVVQQRTLAARTADWADSVTFDQIDPASGILSVTLALTGTLSSSVAVYSLERAATAFSSRDTALVELELPDGSTLLKAGPSTSVSTLLPAATGSAITEFFLPASASASDSVIYTPGPASSADAALLIGTGTITLPVVATARVQATAPGNFGAVFDSQVAATVSTTAVVDHSQNGISSTDAYGALVTAVAVTYGAVTTAQQHVEISPTATGWTQALGIGGFDPSLGTLQRVNITISTIASSSLQAENLDPAAAFLGVQQTATIKLGANGAVLDSQAATIATNRTLAAFDGSIDNAGASGETYQGQAARTTASEQLGDAASLAAFTGPAAAGVTVAGIGQTAIDGPGALSITGALQAGASIDISYTYLPAVGALFDASYYLAHNPDVAAAGVDPYQHYLTFGWKEGRNPSAYFDTHYYLQQNPDVAAAGMDPLLHYAIFGWHEGRDPSLMFGAATYLTAHPGLSGGSDLLAGFEQSLQSLSASGRTASPQFLSGGTRTADPLIDAGYYDRQLGATLMPTDDAAAQQASWSYHVTGWQQGFNPDAFFDTNYYLSHNPDVAAAHIDPLLHYEMFGWHEGRDPSAAFSTSKYLAAYTDVRNAEVDPLLHYVQFGQAEHRTAFAV